MQSSTTQIPEKEMMASQLWPLDDREDKTQKCHIKEWHRWEIIGTVFLLFSSFLPSVIATGHFEWSGPKSGKKKSRRVVGDQNIVRCVKPESDGLMYHLTLPADKLALACV